MRKRQLLIAGGIATLMASCGPPGGPDARNNDENAGTNNTVEGPTYYQDVKPIVDAHCTKCHTADGLGPFALTTYEEVVQVAPLVANAVTTRTMPPFAAAPAVRPLAHDTSLSDEQIATIDDWVDADTPKGDPSSPGDPIEITLPALEKVDLTLGMPDDYTPTDEDGTDVYRCFVLDWPEADPTFITGFQMRPGNLAIDHHAVAYLVDPELTDVVDAADGADGQPGYDCFGGPTPPDAGDLPARFVAAWTPGSGALEFAEGSGMRIAPGSKLVLQMHYSLIEADVGESDSTELDFRLAEEVDEFGGNMPWLDVAWLSGEGMQIPAGEAGVVHEFTADPTTFALLGQFVPGLDPSEGIWIHSALPHLHKLGQQFTIEVDRADGSTEQLLHIDQWDFDWQRFYTFEEPVKVEPGDRLRIRCEWDNTQDAQPLIGGRRATPSDRAWGEGTLDEMCVAAMYVTGVANGSQECADVGSIASDTGRFEVTFDASVRDSNPDEELIGPVRGAIYRAEDVTLMGPRDGTESVASFYYEEMDLRQGPAGPFLIDEELPAGDYQFLGWMDTDDNADPDDPNPDVGDPVMIPARAQTLGCETQRVTVDFPILRPDL